MATSGWNRPSADKPEVVKKGGAKFSPVHGIIAGAIVVVAGIVLLAILSGDEGKAEVKESKKGKIKEVAPAAAPKPVATQAVEKVSENGYDPRYGTPISCTTNAAFGKVCTIYRDAEGKKHKVYRSAWPPIFKHNTDYLLAMALCGNENAPILPLPMSGDLDAAFRASLKDPIEISPDDSPDVVARKQTVIDAREQIRELMDQGGSFSEILTDYRKLFNENREIRNDAARELRRIVDEGDTEGTRQYLLKINIALQQMGIKELDEPKSTAEHREEVLQRLAEREAAKEQVK